mmetsp:Transcript_23346/g.38034  ORF Transcript_23346/g.38034 Transcript_23346/m.38034 type:complete len:268 (+) Transcript_23346:10-813(+)
MVPSGIFPPQGGNCSYSFGGGRQDDGRFLLLYTIGRAERRLLGYCYCNEYLLNSNYSLEFTQCSGYSLKHTSLKRLGPSGWLNDEVVNGFNMHFLRPKLDGSSFIYVSQFMGNLLQTGPSGTDEPNYDYSKVQRWSNRITNDLTSLQNLYIPINHKNIHWLTMRIDFIAKKISLWDSQGRKQTNALYTNAALRYLGGMSMQRPSLTGTCCSGWKLGQLKICRTKVLSKRMTLTAAYSHFSICVCWSKKDPSRKIHTHRQQSSYMQRK